MNFYYVMITIHFISAPKYVQFDYTLSPSYRSKSYIIYRIITSKCDTSVEKLKIKDIV